MKLRKKCSTSWLEIEILGRKSEKEEGRQNEWSFEKGKKEGREQVWKEEGMRDEGEDKKEEGRMKEGKGRGEKEIEEIWNRL